MKCKKIAKNSSSTAAVIPVARVPEMKKKIRYYT